jgi:hypothetical protein
LQFFQHGQCFRRLHSPRSGQYALPARARRHARDDAIHANLSGISIFKMANDNLHIDTSATMDRYPLHQRSFHLMVRSSAIALIVAGTLVSTSSAQDMMRLLPGNHEVKGWTRKAEPKTYEHSQLWEYIDGGADVYLDYGFQRVITEELTNGKLTVIVDIYDMKTAEGAFGIYARERAPTYRFVQIGVEGYQEGSALNFAQENYYVKLTGYADDQATKTSLEKLAQTVSRKIGGQRKLPPVFAFFPWNGKEKHSEAYDVKSYLGKTDLRDTYSVKYNWKSAEFTAFITVAQSDATAINRLKALKSALTKVGSMDKSFKGLAKNLLTGMHREAKELVLAVKGKYIIGAYPAKNTEVVKELLAELLKGIR